MSTGGTFPTTHWTVLDDAADTRSPGQAVALESLCRAYWPPVHAYVCAWAGSPDLADDLTQGFFAHLLEHRALGAAQRERGRFRTFLLTSLRHHLHNRHKHANRLKRNPGETPVSLDELTDTELDSLRHDETPQREFERKWAKAAVLRHDIPQVTRRHGRQRREAAGETFLLRRGGCPRRRGSRAPTARGAARRLGAARWSHPAATKRAAERSPGRSPGWKRFSCGERYARRGPPHHISGPTTGVNVIARNFVHSLGILAAISTTTTVMNGMQFVTGTFTAQNNMVNLGRDASGGSLTAGVTTMRGIYDNGTDAGRNIYHNSVSIGGFLRPGSANSFAFDGSTGVSNARTYQNNILSNIRVNSGGFR